jgi:hypothetical protein
MVLPSATSDRTHSKTVVGFMSSLSRIAMRPGLRPLTSTAMKIHVSKPLFRDAVD